MLGGEPLAGAHGRAGEIGHVHVAGHDDPCACGGLGCLETVASARAVAARYARRTVRDRRRGPLTAAEVTSLVERQDPDAVAVWTEAVSALADVLAGTVSTLDPAAVVLGGGLAKSGELLLAPLRAALAQRVTLGPPPLVTVASLGDNAALVGAGLLARQAASGARQGR
jgi:glucokinase